MKLYAKYILCAKLLYLYIWKWFKQTLNFWPWNVAKTHDLHMTLSHVLAVLPTNPCTQSGPLTLPMHYLHPPTISLVGTCGQLAEITQMHNSWQFPNPKPRHNHRLSRKFGEITWPNPRVKGLCKGVGTWWWLPYYALPTLQTAPTLRTLQISCLFLIQLLPN